MKKLIRLTALILALVSIFSVLSVTASADHQEIRGRFGDHREERPPHDKPRHENFDERHPNCRPDESRRYTEQWSEWSTTYPPRWANETEKRTVVAGYNMSVYVTQEDAEPHLRVFRDFSIANNLWNYGARKSYGEKHLTRYASVEELAAAKAYKPGSFIESNYRGKQSGTSTAYCFKDNDTEYSYFIESEVYVEQYRYR